MVIFLLGLRAAMVRLKAAERWPEEDASAEEAERLN